MKFKLLFFCIALAGSQLWAQPLQNNLLTRYGFGNLMPSATTAIQNLGGAAAAYRDPYQINPDNPASLGFLEHVSFEMGVYAGYSTQQYGDRKLFNYTGNLKHMMLAMPTRNPYADMNERKKHVGMYSTGFVLRPVSQVGYNLTAVTDYPGNDTVTVNANLQGSGGVFAAEWLNAYRYKNISFGLTLGYRFGNINKYRDQRYSNLPNAFREVYYDNLHVTSVTWNTGVQYDLKLKRKNSDPEDPSTYNHLVLGAYGNSGSNFKGDAYSLFYRINSDFNQRDTLFDSTLNPTAFSGKLPGQFSIGAMYEVPQKLRINTAFKTESWSNYSNSREPYSYGNSWSAQAGIEYIPEYNSYNDFWRRIRYRAGLNYGKDRFLENGKALNSFNANVGFGLPIKLPRKQVSFVNIGLSYSNLEGTNLSENLFQLNLGFQLNDDSWFYKRKYE